MIMTMTSDPFLPPPRVEVITSVQRNRSSGRRRCRWRGPCARTGETRARSGAHAGQENQEVEILKEALDLAAPKKPVLPLASFDQDGSR